MKVLNTSRTAPPLVAELRLDSPVSTPGGSFCAPLYVGSATPETLALQLGPSHITGIVQTPHVCYLDLELESEQLAWVRELESTIRSQLPGHKGVWFTRDMQEADIEYFYDSSLRGSKLRARVQRCDTFDTIDLQVFQESGEIGTLSLVEGEANVLALVHVQGVSHRSGRISIDWVLQQALVKRTSGCMIGLGGAAEEPAPASEVPVAPEEPAAPAAPAAPEEPQAITEVDDILASTDTVVLRSETDLVADEVEEQAHEERERRAEALRMFMEANDLDPEAYYFPNTDEESEAEEEEEEEGGAAA